MCWPLFTGDLYIVLEQGFDGVGVSGYFNGAPWVGDFVAADSISMAEAMRLPLGGDAHWKGPFGVCTGVEGHGIERSSSVFLVADDSF